MPSRSATIPIPVVSLLAAALVLSGCDRQTPPPAQPPSGSGAAAGGADPAGTVDRTHRGQPFPALAVHDAAGHTLAAAALGGQPVLLNLWATWCAPCVRELPQLDALAARGVRVVAVSQDIDGAARVGPFFAAHRLPNLAPWLDPANDLGVGLGGQLPVSVLYDAHGREVWRVAGGLDWSGARAAALLREGGVRLR